MDNMALSAPTTTPARIRHDFIASPFFVLEMNHCNRLHALCAPPLRCKHRVHNVIALAHYDEPHRGAKREKRDLYRASASLAAA
jgi:hypothetical protein